MLQVSNWLLRGLAGLLLVGTVNLVPGPCNACTCSRPDLERLTVIAPLIVLGTYEDDEEASDGGEARGRIIVREVEKTPFPWRSTPTAVSTLHERREGEPGLLEEMGCSCAYFPHSSNELKRFFLKPLPNSHGSYEIIREQHLSKQEPAARP